MTSVQCFRDLLLGAMLVALCGSATALTLQTGDIVVLDAGKAAAQISPRVIRIRPANGVQDVVSSGGQLVAPIAIVIDRNRSILVADSGAAGQGSVIRIQPSNGAQTAVPGAPLPGLLGLAMRANDGSLYATNSIGDAVYQINATTGSRSTVTSGSLLAFPEAITVARDGFLYLANFSTSWRILQIDRVSGAQQQISAGFQLLSGLASSTGALWASDALARSVSRIDLASRAVQTVSSGGQLFFPFALAVEDSGQLVVADWGTAAVAATVVRVNSTTGAQTIVSRGQLLAEPRAVAVVASACNDGFDNDGDALADFPADPGCDAVSDGSERSIALVCDDGVDEDGDGLIDFPADPGCKDGLSAIENPRCQDGLDNDTDGKVDFDGGAAANHGVALGPVDPQCASKPWRNAEAASSCGLGAEIVLPLALWVWRRRRIGR